MKRIIITALCLIFILSGCDLNEVYELSSTEGRVLICKNGIFMLIADGSAISLSVDGIEDIDEYSDGDLIRVWHDGVEESYPARTKAYKIKLIKSGDMSDIDENVVRSLSDMGWIEYDDMCQRYLDAGYVIDCETPDNNVKCEYLYCDMSLEIPDTWSYETKKSDTECYIRFRPKEESKGWVTLECRDVQFAVCGTGLSTEETTIGKYKANIGIYDNNEQFSFIRFVDVPGEYVVRNIENGSWFSGYKNGVMSILATATLSPKQLSYDYICSIVDGAVAEYENRYIWFNCFEGVWTVDVYIDSTRYQLKLDTEGNIIFELEALK